MTITLQISISFSSGHLGPRIDTQDSAIALGTAFKQALGEIKGIRRYGTGFAPLDEVCDRSLDAGSLVNIIYQRHFPEQ